MKRFVLFLLAAATLFSTTITKADTEPTRFSGIAIGDSAESAVLHCDVKLHYTVHGAQIQPGMFAIICEPGVEDTDKTYNEATRGKPIEISMLVFEDKIAGIHLLYSNKLTYKKALADFVSSGIMKEGMEKVDSARPLQQTYKNYKENWIGWYYSFDTVTEPTYKLYVIHLETSQSNASIDKENTESTK